MEQVQSFVVENEEAGVRVDSYVAANYPEFSRSYIQKLIKDGKVLANGAQVKPSYKVNAEDEIKLIVPETLALNIEAEDIPLDIIHEDDDIIIVNKPKGMVVHPANGHYSGTLVNALLFHCRESLSGINGVLRPGIVHRIDMDTTGALIVCKNDIAHRAVAEQLKVHSITRKYVGIVHGNFKEPEGRINAPIGRHPNDRKKMSVNTRNGKEAVTNYRVIKEFKGYSFVEFQLETGRTHQIRVHMASINHPLLGDAVYGPAKCPVKNLQGQTLHAKTIGFIHPSMGEYVEYEAKLPEYFEKLLNNLEMK